MPNDTPARPGAEVTLPLDLVEAIAQHRRHTAETVSQLVRALRREESLVMAVRAHLGAQADDLTSDVLATHGMGDVWALRELLDDGTGALGTWATVDALEEHAAAILAPISADAA